MTFKVSFQPKPLHDSMIHTSLTVKASIYGVLMFPSRDVSTDLKKAC